jgi:hypothetical protein|tara:strand:+ start:703 stop:870 length:168 start_codon:yes stop_codon:yes gene_type:complete
MISLPFEIQELIWKKYYTNIVLIEMKQCSVSIFLIDTSKTTRENDMIMMRYNTGW